MPKQLKKEILALITKKRLEIYAWVFLEASLAVFLVTDEPLTVVGLTGAVGAGAAAVIMYVRPTVEKSFKSFKTRIKGD